MNPSGRSADLVEAALSGQRPELARLAAQGQLPLPPESLIHLQLQLASGSDAELASLARQSLARVEEEPMRALLSTAPSTQTLTTLVHYVRSPGSLAELMRHPELPAEAALEAAPRLPPEALEVLVLRQDLLIAQPELVDAIELNPDLPAHLKRRLAEYREHLIPRPQREERLRPVLEEASDEELEAALAAVLREPVGGEIDRETGLSEQQIRNLPLAVRLRLVRGASIWLRGVLLRDSNPLIALAAYERNPLSGGEVEQLVNSRGVVPEILEVIAEDRRWQRKYPIMHALVRNPRTPVAKAIRLVPRLAPRDLKALTRDRNVPEAVRSRAQALYRMRFR